MTSVPDDVQHWIATHVPADRQAQVLARIADSVDHANQPASPRLQRCLIMASRGELDTLDSYLALLKVDWRDVIVAGEYDVHNGTLVRVRDLNQPLPGGRS